MWSSHTMEWYITMRMNSLQLQTIIKINFTNIVLSERRQTQEYVLYDSFHYIHYKNTPTNLCLVGYTYQSVNPGYPFGGPVACVTGREYEGGFWVRLSFIIWVLVLLVLSLWKFGLCIYDTCIFLYGYYTLIKS